MITKTNETCPVSDVAIVRTGKQDYSIVSRQEGKKVSPACAVCGGQLRYGSYDPCEGHYYWCSVCGDGPYGPYLTTIRRDLLARTIENEPPNEGKLRGRPT